VATPPLLESEVSYHRARASFEHDDCQVFNNTVGGKLELFHRLPLSEFLAKNVHELTNAAGAPA